MVNAILTKMLFHLSPQHKVMPLPFNLKPFQVLWLKLKRRLVSILKTQQNCHRSYEMFYIRKASRGQASHVTLIN